MKKGCLWAIGILFGIIVLAQVNNSIQNEEAAKMAEKPLYENVDYVQTAAGELIKDGLRDPDSYEFVDMQEQASSKQGEKLFVVTYRAKNGFGGYNVGKATFVCDKDNLTIVSNEE